MNAYEKWLRPLLFKLDPERAHALTVRALELAPSAVIKAVGSRCRLDRASLETTVAGLRFPNPVGLAAGYDKDCRVAGALPAFGFGFLELGTVTPRPQPGNAAPRVFRIPEARAVINRLGFPGEGAAAAARRLDALGPRGAPIALNLGVNADTPPEKAADDYCAAFQAVGRYADFIVVNVSSPNTSRLRDLQERLKLERVLTALRGLNPLAKPVFVKLSPDLGPEHLADLLPLLMVECQGIVVANTTVSREGLADRWADVRGGLSGEPLKDRATALVAECYRLTKGRLPIIGVGGVATAADAWRLIRAGACLVELYTALVYRGPGLVREILEGLDRLLEEHKLENISQAVGLSHSGGKGMTEAFAANRLGNALPGGHGTGPHSEMRWSPVVEPNGRTP